MVGIGYVKDAITKKMEKANLSKTWASRGTNLQLELLHNMPAKTVFQYLKQIVMIPLNQVLDTTLAPLQIPPPSQNEAPDKYR
jgi:hypothetical protein